MRGFLKLFAVAGLIGLLTACSGSSTKGEDDGAAVSDAGGAGGGATSRGLAGGGRYGDGRGMNGPGNGQPGDLLSQRVIYFQYDSSDVTQEGRDILAAHAAWLAEHRNATVVLEGHADERGSREYNIALGERRAKGVKTILLFMGAGEEQLSTVSYGEEKPASLGHDEEAYHLNRRVELNYRESR